MNTRQHHAVMRLKNSRLALASQADAATSVDPSDDGDDTYPRSGISDLLGHPMVALASQTFKQLAMGHPLFASATVLGQGLKQGASTTIRRHPLLSVAAGLAVGAMLVHQRRRALALVGLYALPSLRSAIGQTLSMLLSSKAKQ